MTSLRKLRSAVVLLAAGTPAASAQAETVHMGGLIQGKAVISQLGVSELEARKKHSVVARRGGFKIDLNRVWPGNKGGGNAPTRHAGLVFNKLVKPNADYALDYHTAATRLTMQNSAGLLPNQRNARGEIVS